ncbi:TetR/AcrR family transcriptional regulator [Paenibacillus psychroresistens]|uniref:TetR/AcrR family transcriptional regulator n=2 Tax=Paenibacillus psychroresistens TaxID=1778678 RepID=A0A6B8RHT1_9BACL|nr:TetR/AcrR family transcriptional regulator [Paenibacillus psychroresistens]
MKLVNKVVPMIRRNGFQSLKMEEIAKHMDVSKATLYKYFSSKVDVIDAAVSVLVDYIREQIAPQDGNLASFGRGFQMLFEQSVILGAYISDGFLKELQAVYEDQHQRLQDAMLDRQAHISSFYRQGIQNGVFHANSEQLMFLQDYVLTRAMLEVKFLMQYQLTLEQVIAAYYGLVKNQLIKAEFQELVDDTVMHAVFVKIAAKVTRDLH